MRKRIALEYALEIRAKKHASGWLCELTNLKLWKPTQSDHNWSEILKQKSKGINSTRREINEPRITMCKQFCAPFSTPLTNFWNQLIQNRHSISASFYLIDTS